MSSVVKFSTIGDLLKGTPFDTRLDHSGTLTEEIFYRDFYVKPPSMKAFSADLLEKLDNPHLTHVVTFISGYAGNGKTTFLRSFINEHPEYRHVYFAASEWHGDSGGRKTAPSADPVMSMMNRDLLESPGIADTMTFVNANRDVLKRQNFISRRLSDFLKRQAREEPYDRPAVEACIDELDFEDTFAILFVHLFRTAIPNQKTIVYFDNLDIAPIEYIASQFWENFQDALTTAERLSTDTIFERRVDFHNDFRFVFCLRDTNDAVLNAHLAGRLDAARLPFTMAFDSDFYSKIVIRRLDYFEKHYPDQDIGMPVPQYCVIFRALLEDDTFHEVFMRLYNFDYRSVVTALVTVLKEWHGPAPSRKVTYGARGTLMFGFLKILLEQNFLGDYLDQSKRKKDGWCYIDRVMLTVLINRSNYHRGVRESDKAHPYGLYNLVQDLMPLYDDAGTIIDSIARCFLHHLSGWVHLVTIMNRRIEKREDRDQFVSRLATMVKEASGPGNVSRRNELNAIVVRVNPAGFAYVRYVLTHFEFYSHLVHNARALFDDPLGGKEDVSRFVYAFEAKIDKVLAQVSEHVEMMKKFFDQRYVSMRVSGENFPRSPYCFRHQGTARIAKTDGQSHTISLVSSHIDYIDHFRSQLVGGRRMIDDDAEAERVNQLLCDKLDKYVNLLAFAPDQSEATRLAKQFRVKIDEIRGDRDVTT